jgi:His/Glu/Gln/Arg/opine family amino acid ABC transporter permease subunit
MTLFWNCLPLLIKGAQMTLAILTASCVISFFLGIIFGILLSNRLRIRGVSECVEGLAFVYRAVPFYVQLLIIYFVLPDLLWCNLEPFSAAVIALGGCSAGYVAQVVRSGINAVPDFQWESAFVLGYNRIQALRHIILPQALRFTLPNLCNELDAMLKSTSIACSIGLLELTRASMNLVSREMEPVPIYLITALFYLVMSLCINILMRFLERRLSCYKLKA